MIIRPVAKSDRKEWLRMRTALWPDSAKTFDRDTARFFDGSDDRMATLVMERPGGGLGGFIELGWRNFVDECTTSPVAYIEGWYVDPDLRRTGVGRALVLAGEAWAREHGMLEMASDAEIDNETSIQAHRALGYEITGRIVGFRKRLGEPRGA